MLVPAADAGRFYTATPPSVRAAGRAGRIIRRTSDARFVQVVQTRRRNESRIDRRTKRVRVYDDVTFMRFCGVYEYRRHSVILL